MDDKGYELIGEISPNDNIFIYVMFFFVFFLHGMTCVFISKNIRGGVLFWKKHLFCAKIVIYHNQRMHNKMHQTFT